MSSTDPEQPWSVRLAPAIDALKADFPGITTTLETFPSGAFMLDVTHRGRHYVLSYMPSRNLYGIDTLEHVSFDSSFHFAAKSLDGGVAKLRELLTGTLT